MEKVHVSVQIVETYLFEVLREQVLQCLRYVCNAGFLILGFFSGHSELHCRAVEVFFLQTEYFDRAEQVAIN